MARDHPAGRGRLVHFSGDIDRPLMLINELCPSALPGDGDENGWRKVWLAGACLAELGLIRARQRSVGPDLIQRVRTHLLALMGRSQLAPRERAEAASILGVLEDPRNLDEMVAVPGGPFEMGGERYSDKKPRHTVTVDDFRISKYPVTNSQYARFVAATDHPAPAHWRGNRPPPELLTHPVVYVSWHDAQAYCRWLSQERGQPIRLPTEAEWEKAARGTDGREYPWGNDFDPQRCNMNQTGIDATSPVGIFPNGASPYGCLDMAGNVWEWTSSHFKPYPYDGGDGREDLTAPDSVARVLRGGSFANSGDGVRCASRDGDDPNYRSRVNGFRVLAPGF